MVTTSEGNTDQGTIQLHDLSHITLNYLGKIRTEKILNKIFSKISKKKKKFYAKIELKTLASNHNMQECVLTGLYLLQNSNTNLCTENFTTYKPITV